MKKKKDEIYISIDVETDGPIPGEYSMLSLGAAAYTKEGNQRDIFGVNFETLPGAKQHPDTMAWWAKEAQQEAWTECRKNLVLPERGMLDFVKWVDSFSNYSPVAVGYPAGFDFLFVYWYLIKFVGRSPFSFSCIDIKSAAMFQMKTDYRQSTKKNMPKRWFAKNMPHTHVAWEDAAEQGVLFCNILKENRKTNA